MGRPVHLSGRNVLVQPHFRQSARCERHVPLQQTEYDNGDALPYRTQGIAGRFSYTYDSRYVAELNFGYNGSENFAKGKRFGFFPAVALGWIVSSEKFMEPVSDVISNLKLRATWGKAGNSNIGGN